MIDLCKALVPAWPQCSALPPTVGVGVAAGGEEGLVKGGKGVAFEQEAGEFSQEGAGPLAGHHIRKADGVGASSVTAVEIFHLACELNPAFDSDFTAIVGVHGVFGEFIGVTKGDFEGLRAPQLVAKAELPGFPVGGFRDTEDVFLVTVGAKGLKDDFVDGGFRDQLELFFQFGVSGLGFVEGGEESAFFRRAQRLDGRGVAAIWLKAKPPLFSFSARYSVLSSWRFMGMERMIIGEGRMGRLPVRGSISARRLRAG